MIGQNLHNRYRVTAQLGKGAMGVVYRATDRQTRAEVALKVISSDLELEPEMLARFQREGEALRLLRHRNIVAFVEMFAHQGHQVIVMEYIGGGNLRDLIAQGPVPLGNAVRIALELSDALAQAHHINIIHRDLKPENVLRSEAGTPKLTDFGVARLLSETKRLTGTGALVGTPYYMSPEAWQGRPLDARADVWSLGVALYEMVTGRVPFEGDTLPAVMSKVMMELPPDPRTLRADIPPELVQIISRMLAREKAERYKSMRQLAADLERCLEHVPPEPLPASVSKAEAGRPEQIRREPPPLVVAAPPKPPTNPPRPVAVSARPAPNPPAAAQTTVAEGNVRQLMPDIIQRVPRRRTWMWGGLTALVLVCLFGGVLGAWAMARNGVVVLPFLLSATPTATLSPSPSATPTRKPTATRTATSAPTSTATLTITPTITATPTATPTSTTTMTPTRTRAPTRRPTARPVIIVPTSTPVPAEPTSAPPSGGGGGGGGGNPPPPTSAPPPPTPVP